MNHDRLNPTVVAPELYKTVFALDRYVRQHVDSTLLHLVELRASLIKRLRVLHRHALHRRPRRPGSGPPACSVSRPGARHRCPATPSKAALALTDPVTRIGDEGVPDAVWDTARLHLDDNAVLDLVGAIAAINVMNRPAITLRKAPASAGTP